MDNVFRMPMAIRARRALTTMQNSMMVPRRLEVQMHFDVVVSPEQPGEKLYFLTCRFLKPFQHCRCELVFVSDLCLIFRPDPYGTLRAADCIVFSLCVGAGGTTNCSDAGQVCRMFPV